MLLAYVVCLGGILGGGFSDSQPQCTAVIDTQNTYQDVQACEMRSAEIFDDDAVPDQKATMLCLPDMPLDKAMSVALTIAGYHPKVDSKWEMR
jgi:hypothetical protein